MRIFDTHAHLLDEQFDADREELLSSLPAEGIAHVMEACCDEAGIDRNVHLSTMPFASNLDSWLQT